MSILKRRYRRILPRHNHLLGLRAHAVPVLGRLPLEHDLLFRVFIDHFRKFRRVVIETTLTQLLDVAGGPRLFGLLIIGDLFLTSLERRMALLLAEHRHGPTGSEPAFDLGLDLLVFGRIHVAVLVGRQLVIGPRKRQLLVWGVQ